MAHNIAYMSPAGVFDIPISWLSDRTVTFSFVEKIRPAIDFIGLNYYGQEFFQGSAVGVMREEEYSDSGRAIYPDGLYWMIKSFWKRFQMPIFITENGALHLGLRRTNSRN
jgi:beta-glucosidase/6-phospho-beta-glucosidase/beta-galactosidase